MRVKGERIRVTVNKKMLEWVDAVVDTGFFANRSHAIDWGMYLLKKRLDKDRWLQRRLRKRGKSE